MNAFKRLQEVFTTFRERNDLYQVSNGEVFFRFSDAVNYARTLKDHSVRKWTRAEAFASPADGDIVVSLRDVEIQKLDYSNLKKLAAQLHLETADQKKDTLLAALLEAQNQATEKHE